MRLNLSKNNQNTADNTKNNNKKDYIPQEFLDEIQNDVEQMDTNYEDQKEMQERSEKRYKSLKTRKIVILTSVSIFLIGIIILGFYNTFLKHEYTGQEIANIANAYNNTTNFPIDGVQGYLSANANELIQGDLIPDAGIKNYSLTNPVVTRINKKSDTLANVYFYATLSTTNGENKVDCFLPLSWNKDEMAYQPTDKIIITPNSTTVNNKEYNDEASILSFKGIEKMNEENTKSAEAFCKNFFTMLYSNQDITPYYKGDLDLKSDNLKFVDMSEFAFYKETNKNGYNATANVILQTENGVSYSTAKYITIEKTGDSWMITAIL